MAPGTQNTGLKERKNDLELRALQVEKLISAFQFVSILDFDFMISFGP